ncbi:MAG: beta-ketoacyl-ACP synthase III [Desulfobacterales bacterium]
MSTRITRPLSGVILYTMEYAARITGIGSAFPEKHLSNEELIRMLAHHDVETSEQWILDRTGIRERRIANVENEAENNSSLGARAARKALKMAGRKAEDIDQIIYATCSPDTLLPSTACWLQKKIGASNAWAMDINAACSGFVYGLVTAQQFILSGQARTILVVGGEVLSQITNWSDRSSCILFGDGAGAVIVERVPAGSRQCILSSHLTSNGSLSKLFYVPAGGSNLEVTPERYAQNLHKMRMNGREIFKVAVRTLTDCALRTLEKRRLPIVRLDWFVPHQANLRIIEAVANRLAFPMDRVLVNLEHYGNTSAATIPSVLDEAVRDGRIREGQTILLDAFGAGLTAGAVLLRW